jgi:hypothetical protein
MIVVAAACVIGSVIGLLMVSIAMDHNPQEAFVNHSTGVVDYAALAGIFLSWSVAVGAVTGLVLMLVAWSD